MVVDLSVTTKKSKTYTLYLTNSMYFIHLQNRQFPFIFLFDNCCLPIYNIINKSSFRICKYHFFIEINFPISSNIPPSIFISCHNWVIRIIHNAFYNIIPFSINSKRRSQNKKHSFEQRKAYRLEKKNRYSMRSGTGLMNRSHVKEAVSRQR